MVRAHISDEQYSLLSAGTARRAGVDGGAGKETPQEVLRLLGNAYGEDALDETGLHTTGHSLKDCSSLDSTVHNLTYGELLTVGVSKAMDADRLDMHNPNTKIALELGMGTGKVAMQCFLECPNLERVIGIELVPGRYMEAEKALSKLMCCGKYQLDTQTQDRKFSGIDNSLSSNMSRSAVLSEGSRKLEIYCGDMMSLPMEVVAQADVIFAQVVLPDEAQLILQGLLSHAKDGSRAFLYNDLAWTWARDRPSHFQRMQSNASKRGWNDLYATSWLPRGRKFYIFEADSNTSPTITKEKALMMRNDRRRMNNMFGMKNLHWLLLGTVGIFVAIVLILGIFLHEIAIS
jgi:hypothetical protein